MAGELNDKVPSAIGRMHRNNFGKSVQLLQHAIERSVLQLGIHNCADSYRLGGVVLKRGKPKNDLAIYHSMKPGTYGCARHIPLLSDRQNRTTHRAAPLSIRRVALQRSLIAHAEIKADAADQQNNGER